MTQSAKALGLTQSGVSQTIAALEEAVGTRLFDRSVRPIVLTSAGRSLLKRGQHILQQTREAYLETSETNRKQLSTLAVAMPESLANLIGPKLFEQNEELSRNWKLWSGLAPAQREDFFSHAVDLLVSADSNFADVPGLERHSIVSEPFILIFPADYNGAMKLGPHLRDLKLIRFSLRSTTGRQTEAQLNRLRLQFDETVEFDNAAAQTAAVADGSGWAITTPLCILQRADLIERLKLAPINRGGFYRHFELVARENALGSIPETIADSCRRILQDDVLPILFEKASWLRERMLCRTTRHIYRQQV